MKVLILAAGFSTRLYPITQYFPKALLPIGDKPILQYTIDDLTNLSDTTGTALISNHRYLPIFSTWIKTYYPHIGVFDNGASSPETRLGAIGDLVFALNKLAWDDDLLVLSSDVLTSLKLKDFIDFFGSHRGVVNAIFDTHDPEIIRNRLGCATVEKDVLVKFTEKPKNPETTLTSVPFYIFPKESMPLLRQYHKEGHPADAPGAIIAWLIGKTPTFAYNIGSGYYYDVGTVEAYNKLSSQPPAA